MKITFRNRNLRRTCEEQKKAQKKLGTNSARKLRARLGDLESVSRVSELVAGKPHPLKGDRDGEFSLELAGGCRVTFSPDHEPYPRKSDGSIDWTRVTDVCIEFIGDYHD